MFSVEEKDRVLCRVAESDPQYIDIDMKNDPDKLIVRHLINLGLFKENTKKGSGNKSRVSITSKGGEIHAQAGFKGERKKEIVAKIWKALEFIKPW